MSGVAACLSDKLRRLEARWEGRLVDVNTGTLRRDHVLVQRTPGIELFIGLGASAAQAMVLFSTTLVPMTLPQRNS